MVKRGIEYDRALFYEITLKTRKNYYSHYNSSRKLEWRPDSSRKLEWRPGYSRAPILVMALSR